jgi:hypothetical protein
VSDVHQ